MPLFFFVFKLLPHFMYFYVVFLGYKKGSESDQQENTNTGVYLTRAESIYVTILRLIFSLIASIIVIALFPSFNVLDYVGFFCGVFCFSNRLSKIIAYIRAGIGKAIWTDHYFQQRTIKVQAGVNHVFFTKIIPLFLIHYPIILVVLNYVRVNELIGWEAGKILFPLWLINVLTFNRITYPFFLPMYQIHYASGKAYLLGREKEKRNKKDTDSVDDIWF